MTPLRLRLRGFAGIKSGLGRDEYVLDLGTLDESARIVALAGPNGVGKTTVIDNLHPYRLMPSRSPGLTPASFSFYEHLASPEAEKELDWEHGGIRYRSTLVFRVNGRRTTDAYIHEVADGAMRPVVLPDGTVSNGSTSTYDRIVEAILGSPESFFTAVFSAQNRRPLASYGNAEAKGLMADLLGLESVRKCAEQAGQVQRLLRASLEECRAQLRAQLEASTSLVAARSAQAALDADLFQAARELSLRREAVSQAQRALGKAQELARGQLAIRQQRALATGQLAQERESLRRLEEQNRVRQGNIERRRADIERAAQQSRADSKVRLARLAADERTAVAQAADAERVAAAAVERSTLEAAIASAVEAVSVARQDDARHAALQAEIAVLTERVRALEQRAGAATLRARELRERHQLTAEVPCYGTELQGACKLLADAHAARPLLPSAAADVERLGAERSELQSRIGALQRERELLAAAPLALKSAETELDAQRRRLDEAAQLAARAPVIAAARQRIGAIAEELAELAARDEQREAERLAAHETLNIEASRAHDEASAAIAEAERRIAARQELLDALPTLAEPPDAAASAHLAAAQAALAIGEQAHLQALERQADGSARIAVLAAASALATELRARTEALEDEVKWWTLLAKALGNDGVIALCVDDAGPALAQLTNELLRSCYGERFAVSIRTQLESAAGKTREGFDILVSDAVRGDAKSVSLMSGGERVWINECLTRAVALFLSRTAARQYETLFCDETDGALDADRKRQFMQMKREVLRIGGYRREFFISQTPELAAMADAVINLAHEC